MQLLKAGSLKSGTLRVSSSTRVAPVPRFAVAPRHRPAKVLSRRGPARQVCRPVAHAAGEPCTCGPKPTGPHWQQALAELDKKEGRKLMVCQIAPAVRVAISEPFGLPSGKVTIGQITTGLKQLGFDLVFDTLFGADLTIMEEGNELLHRLKDHLDGHPNKEEPMPMFTSCCPGWVEMVEKSYPDMIPYLSSCKSPQMMLGAIIKNFYAETTGYKPEDICACSIMPCTRKQGEADRTDSTTGVARDVDHVITTAELAKIFQDRGINLPELPETPLDNPIGIGSGAGQLFGTTGGVMEAALRTVYEVVTGRSMERLNLTEVRGLEGIKEATLTLQPSPDGIFAQYPASQGEGLQIRVAVANGLGNAKKLVKSIQEGSAKYDFIEVMACPGGCIGGGGQPRNPDKQILQKRQGSMYTIDERMTLRRSHENPFIQLLYSKFLGEPLGHKAHHLLHTHYTPGGPKVPTEAA